MKFRKKPVIVDAVQYLGGEESQDAVCDFMSRSIGVVNNKIIIDTLEGDMEASPGDWIIKGINGEYYPCKPDIFEKTYEPVLENNVA